MELCVCPVVLGSALGGHKRVCDGRMGDLFPPPLPPIPHNVLLMDVEALSLCTTLRCTTRPPGRHGQGLGPPDRRGQGVGGRRSAVGKASGRRNAVGKASGRRNAVGKALEAAGAPWARPRAAGAPWARPRAGGAMDKALEAAGAPWARPRAGGAMDKALEAAGAPWARSRAAGAPWARRWKPPCPPPALPRASTPRPAARLHAPPCPPPTSHNRMLRPGKRGHSKPTPRTHTHHHTHTHHSPTLQVLPYPTAPTSSMRGCVARRKSRPTRCARTRETTPS